jgi:hypothetical protein
MCLQAEFTDLIIFKFSILTDAHYLLVDTYDLYNYSKIIILYFSTFKIHPDFHLDHRSLPTTGDR